MKMTLGFYIHPVNFLLDCRLLFDAFLGYCLRLSKWVRLESIFTAVKPGKSDMESHRKRSDYRISGYLQQDKTLQGKFRLITFMLVKENRMHIFWCIFYAL